MSETTTERPRPRVAFTPGSIAKTATARRRYICGNHLDREKHYIEPGQRHVRNALPPHNSEIGNDTWWHLRVCLDCCPVEHDERDHPTPTVPDSAPGRDEEQQHG